MEQEKIINIEELVQDEHNFNKGTDDGGKLMERSFKEMGAGRSVLIDKHGKIIAGNKSQKAAIAAGIKRVRVIETTGDELIAVKRTDVELESEQGRKMALLDNLTTQVNLAWDVRAPFTQGGGLRRGCGMLIAAKYNIRNYEGISIRAYVGLASRDLASPFLWCLLRIEASRREVVQSCRHHHITPSVVVSVGRLSADAVVRPYDAETLHPLHDGG